MTDPTDMARRRRLLRLETEMLASRTRDLQIRVDIELRDDRLTGRARDAPTLLEDLAGELNNT